MGRRANVTVSVDERGAKLFASLSLSYRTNTTMNAFGAVGEGAVCWHRRVVFVVSCVVVVMFMYSTTSTVATVLVVHRVDDSLPFHGASLFLRELVCVS